MSTGTQSPPRWLGRAVLQVAGLAALLYAVIALAPVWIVLLGSVLLAILLDSAASFLCKRVFRGRLPNSQVLGVSLVVVLLAGSMTALALLLGPSIKSQSMALVERLPRAVERLSNTLTDLGIAWAGLPSASEVGALLQPGSATGQRIYEAFGSVLGGMGSAALVFVIGLYLALQPQPYVRGVLTLIPNDRVKQAQEVLSATHHALKQWLLGRLAAMFAVFSLTTVTLWLLDVPLALSLGLLAGLLTFIPFIGPWLSAIPAVLLGLLESELLAIWIAVAYTGVQAVEGNLITPLIQSYAVSLRPALLVSAQLVAAALFGFPGVVVATPLAVIVVVFVQVLYVRHYLGKEVVPLGQG